MESRAAHAAGLSEATTSAPSWVVRNEPMVVAMGPPWALLLDHMRPLATAAWIGSCNGMPEDDRVRRLKSDDAPPAREGAWRFGGASRAIWRLASSSSNSRSRRRSFAAPHKEGLDGF